MSHTFVVTYLANNMIRQHTLLAGDKKEAWKLTKERIAIKGMKKCSVVRKKG